MRLGAGVGLLVDDEETVSIFVEDSVSVRDSVRTDGEIRRVTVSTLRDAEVAEDETDIVRRDLESSAVLLTVVDFDFVMDEECVGLDGVTTRDTLTVKLSLLRVGSDVAVLLSVVVFRVSVIAYDLVSPVSLVLRVRDCCAVGESSVALRESCSVSELVEDTVVLKDSE